MGRTVAIAIALLILVGALATQLIPQDSVSEATVNQALIRYREAMKRAAEYPKHRGAEIPAFGVYRYRTEGAETIDSASFTASHGYDGVSTVTFLPTRCGVLERWQPLRERWFEGSLCVGRETTHVVGFRDFHEFFGRSKFVDYRCVGDRVPYASALRAGFGWQTRCSAEEGSVTSDVEVVGLERVRVGGELIDAVRLRSEATLAGDPDGSGTQESWLRRTDGLLLRRVNSSTADVSVAGGGTFTEEYELRLLSTAPRR